MPGPSVWPFLSAVCTAGFFLLLTVQAYGVGVLSGIFAVLFVLRWMWETDRPVQEASVDIGAGIRVPTYATGTSTHGWWAMMILIIVIGMIFLMGAFSYLYLYGRNPELWIDPPPIMSTLAIMGMCAVAAALAAWSRIALLKGGGKKRLSIWLLILSAALLAITLFADIATWRSVGLSPDQSGQGATVYAFLGLQGCLVAISALMAAFVAARGARGFIVTPRSNLVDLPAIFFVFTGLMGAALAALTRLVPGAL